MEPDANRSDGSTEPLQRIAPLPESHGGDGSDLNAAPLPKHTLVALIALLLVPRRASVEAKKTYDCNHYLYREFCIDNCVLKFCPIQDVT